MTKSITLPALKPRTSHNLLCKFAIGCFLLASNTTIAYATNKATQLELENCGNYKINQIQLQRKRPGSSWEEVTIFDFNGEGLPSNYSFCVDVSQIESDGDPVFAVGDQARFSVDIDAGDSKSCDGTNYGASGDGKNRRSMKMGGNATKNNSCKTVSYKSTRIQQQCSARGEILSSNSC